MGIGISMHSVYLEFDRKPPVYFGSELLTGIVQVMPFNAQVQFQQLSIELVGNAVYETIVQNGSEKRREVLTFTFLRKRGILSQLPQSQENVSPSNHRNTWLFEIELPKDVPPTFEIPHMFHKNHPAVEYSVIACLEQSVLGVTDTKKINFIPPMLINPETSAIVSSVNRHNVYINVELPQGLSYVSGEIIQGTIEIDNPQNKQIRQVECTIEQTLQVQRDRVTSNIVAIILPTIGPSTEQHLEETFEILLPEDMLPSFIYNAPKETSGFPYVNVSYSIKFEVFVEGLLTDFSVTKPLTITIDPWKHENDGTIILIDRAQPPQLP